MHNCSPTPTNAAKSVPSILVSQRKVRLERNKCGGIYVKWRQRNRGTGLEEVNTYIEHQLPIKGRVMMEYGPRTPTSQSNLTHYIRGSLRTTSSRGNTGEHVAHVCQAELLTGGRNGIPLNGYCTHLLRIKQTAPGLFPTSQKPLDSPLEIPIDS